MLKGFFNFGVLEQQLRYTLGKKDKLKSTKIIEQLFNQGKSFSLFPFKVIYLFTDNTSTIENGQLQVALSVGKKFFKKATDRNRIRRLMREAWRLQKHLLESDVKAKSKNFFVFIIYTGNELPEYEIIFEKTAAVIKRLKKIYDEGLTSNS